MYTLEIVLVKLEFGEKLSKSKIWDLQKTVKSINISLAKDCQVYKYNINKEQSSP